MADIPVNGGEVRVQERLADRPDPWPPQQLATLSPPLSGLPFCACAGPSGERTFGLIYDVAGGELSRESPAWPRRLGIAVVVQAGSELVVFRADLPDGFAILVPPSQFLGLVFDAKTAAPSRR